MLTPRSERERRIFFSNSANYSSDNLYPLLLTHLALLTNMSDTSKSVLSNKEFSFLEVDPTIIGFEVKEISNEATKDVLFEQAESNKRSNSNKSDQPKKKHKNQVKQI